jgi:hypothetical protein
VIVCNYLGDHSVFVQITANTRLTSLALRIDLSFVILYLTEVGATESSVRGWILLEVSLRISCACQKHIRCDNKAVGVYMFFIF